MATSQLWHCTNPDCRSEEILQPHAPAGAPPRCGCGAPMKKKYASPVFHYLDFLRDEVEPAMAEPVVQERRGE